MALVRPQQVQALDDSAVAQFRESAAEHARQAFPKHMRYLDADELMARVDESIERAHGFGIEKSGGMLLVLDLSFLLGNGYPDDPQIPWAGEILRQELNEGVKLDRLHRASMEYLRDVSGPQNEHIDAAQEKMRTISLDDLPAKAGRELEASIARKMHDVFPEKFRYLGRDGVLGLVRAANAGADGYGITNPRGVAVYTGLMYMLGSGFDEDVLYRWAQDILRDGELAESEKISRLYSGAMDFLGEWCG